MSLEWHRRAERLLELAERAERSGEKSEAESLFFQAAREEAEAVRRTPDEWTKTRGVLGLSTVSLYHRAGAFADARRVGEQYLASGLPESLRVQIEELVLDSTRLLQAAQAQDTVSALSDEEFLIEVFRDALQAGRSEHDAFNIVVRTAGNDRAAAKRAIERFRATAEGVRSLGIPALTEDGHAGAWYVPRPDGPYWTALQRLLGERGWDGTDDSRLSSLNQASDKVMALLDPPYATRFATRGLVVGYVQSGKTANFTAVIAKAADQNFRLFIVFSGIHNALRSQTQRRLDVELGDLHRGNLVVLTTVADDFDPGSIEHLDALLSRDSNVRVLCIVKKNARVLTRLRTWLEGVDERIRDTCPTLVIDDEADQASISGNAKRQAPVNREVMRILQAMPRLSYVGYTATPFANVLIDPKLDNLYPRDFIVSLPKPDGYFGPEQIFGRERLNSDDPEAQFPGLGILQTVEEEELPYLKPAGRRDRQSFQPQLTASLSQATRYFWMASAARLVRGEREEHSSMLVHTTPYAGVHRAFKTLLNEYRNTVLRQLGTADAGLLSTFRTEWERQTEAVPASLFSLQPVSFEELLPYLAEIVERTEVIMENSLSEERLQYEDPKPRIVTGGNILSRGLTLEGLMTSFFVREANTYDTLLQMGRWFGYKPGFADLCRIWMTRELQDYFLMLATVEQEIRDDIARYDGGALTPLQFQVRIRTHEKLLPTARGRMGAATRLSASFADSVVQTLKFKVDDDNWLQHKIDWASALIDRAVRAGVDPESRTGGRYLLRDVPVDLIIEFLRSYDFHHNESGMPLGLLEKYIRDEVKKMRLRQWRVLVASLDQSGTSSPPLDLGHGVLAGLVERSRLIIGPKETANLGALFSLSDSVVALELESAVRGLDTEKTHEVLRERRSREEGLLLIYPVDRNSKARPPRLGRPATRQDLNAVNDLIGIAIDFPPADGEGGASYIGVRLPDADSGE